MITDDERETMIEWREKCVATINRIDEVFAEEAGFADLPRPNEEVGR